MSSRRTLYAVVAWAALGGCVSVPRDNVVSGAASRLPTTWRASQKSTDETADVAAWWARFSDAELRSLIDAALAHNYDLQAAIERTRQARAVSSVARSTLFPTLNVDALAARQRSHFPPPVYLATEEAMGASGSWNIDIFGGNQLTALAAAAQALASVEARRDFEVALTAHVATVYMSLRGLQRQYMILAENIAVRADTLDLTQARYRAGLASDLDVARAQTQLQQAQALVPDLQRQIDNDAGTLAVLVGNPPESVDETLLTARAVPPVPPALPKVAPAELLARRPDLRQAMRRVDAATAEAGAAKTDRLPKFTLSFSDSIDRLAFGHLPAVTNNVFSLGFGVFWPLFDAGRIRANIDAHDAALREAEYAFDQTLLNALQDVETAYTDVRAMRDRTARLGEAVDSAQRASELAQALYEAGEADFLAVLDAHRQLLDSQREWVQAQTDAALSTVVLYRALGGGWRDSDETPSDRFSIGQRF